MTDLSPTDFRTLCAELINEAIYLGELPYEQDVHPELLTRARAALAQPEPVAPTDEELIEVFWEHQNGMEELWVDDWPAAARAVLAKWGHQ